MFCKSSVFRHRTLISFTLWLCQNSYRKESSIVMFPINNMLMFHRYVQLPDGRSHKIPLNHHFPMVFLWLSYGFPMMYTLSRKAMGRPGDRCQTNVTKPGNNDSLKSVELLGTEDRDENTWDRGLGMIEYMLNRCGCVWIYVCVYIYIHIYKYILYLYRYRNI